MIKVLLTGANGQVGHDIVRHAPKEIALISLDKQQLNIVDHAAIRNSFATYQPDIVINAAAYTAVDKAEAEPDLAHAVNAHAVEYLAKECDELSIPLIHISTDYVFDGNQNKPYKEDDLTAPLGVYGKSKWQGEEAIRRVLKQHFILRTSWVFGAQGNNFVKTVLRLAKQHSPLRIVADQWGCPTSAAEIAKVIWYIISHHTTQWGTYHFANYPAVTWWDFAKKIIEISQLPNEVIPITTADYPTLAKRPSYSVLDCSKIEKVFGVKPAQWSEALSQMLARQPMFNAV